MSNCYTTRLLVFSAAFLGVLAHPPLIPYREIPREIHMAQRSRIAVNYFTPKNINKRMRRDPVNIGENFRDPVDELVESIPPFDRINALHLLSIFARTPGMHKSASSESNHPQIRSYMSFLIGNSYMESVLLEKLAARIHDPSAIPATASDICETFREQFASKLGRSLHFITPRILKDWLDVMGAPRSFRIRIADELIPPETTNGRTLKISDKALVDLELSTFKNIIGRRLNKLILTGYENIDL